jgi:hypothetical protein
MGKNKKQEKRKQKLLWKGGERRRKEEKPADQCIAQANLLYDFEWLVLLLHPHQSISLVYAEMRDPLHLFLLSPLRNEHKIVENKYYAEGYILRFRWGLGGLRGITRDLLREFHVPLRHYLTKSERTFRPRFGYKKQGTCYRQEREIEQEDEECKEIWRGDREAI